ncbi:MAG: hypothetical protein ACI9OJ_002963, partial [Myxococcota bacterium]
ARPSVDRVSWTLPTEPDVVAEEGIAPGTVPDEVPDTLVVGSAGRPTSAQPAPIIRRVIDTAVFVFEGHDPLAETPRVTLEIETASGFEAVRDGSGRLIDVHAPELLLMYTPDPLTGDGPRRHLYAVTWQAVAPLGGAIADAAGVPLGRYRFRAEGRDYSLPSDPFDVVGADSLTVEASRDGATVTGRAFFRVNGGYRLLRLDGPSEGNIPVTGAISVSGVTVDVDAEGRFSLRLEGNDPIEVIDHFGNRGTQ